MSKKPMKLESALKGVLRTENGEEVAKISRVFPKIVKYSTSCKGSLERNVLLSCPKWANSYLLGREVNKVGLYSGYSTGNREISVAYLKALLKN